MGIIYDLLAFIDWVIYSLASSMFRIIIDIANVEFFNVEQITTIANRIYIVVGVLMLFKLVISAVQYMINPDTFDDKEKGVAGILKKTAISLGLIVAVPAIFNFMVSIQGSIIKTLPSIILGTEPAESADYDKLGNDLSFTVLSSFVKVNENKGSNEITDIDSFKSKVTQGCPRLFGNVDDCKYNYMIIISTISGGFLCYVLLSMILDVAIRTIKFSIIRILAPIPISSYVFSKDKLSKFVKTTITVYTDLFIRLAIVYFIIFAIQNIVIESNLFKELAKDGGWFRETIIRIAIIFGLLMFAKTAPKFISELLGIPDIGAGDMKDMFRSPGGLAGLGASIGAYRNARDYGEGRFKSLGRATSAGTHATASRLKEIASGKNLKESYKTAKDSTMARTNRNLEYANRYPKFWSRQGKKIGERIDAYTGVTTGGKKASGTIAAANTLLEGRTHSWNRAESKVLESPGKYSRATTIACADGNLRDYNVSQMLTRMKALEAGGQESYVGELQDLTNNRQKVLDTAKQEFIERSFTDLASGDGQQRNVFAEDVFKLLRSGGDPKLIGGVLNQTFDKKDADGNVIIDPATGQNEKVTVNLKDVANMVAEGKALDEYQARAMAEYIATKMNADGGRMRVQATQTQTSEPKSS